MTSSEEPSYTDLVYAVLQSAERPLTLAEILEAVNRRRPVTTRDPRATMRGILNQGRQLIKLEDGRYGYLPHLVQGSRLRLPLTEKKPANHPLIFPGEVRLALWSSFGEIQKRQVRRPIQVRLPQGAEFSLPLEFLGTGIWGSPMPEVLRRYLVENRAAAGDALLIRVDDAEAERAEAVLEPRRRRDAAAVAERNRELADAVYAIIRRSRGDEVYVWNLTSALLARGLYRADVPPDSLETVLQADPRLVDAGFSAWTLAEKLTPELVDAIRDRKQAEAKFYPPAAEPPAGTTDEAPSVLASRRAMERSLVDITAALSEQEFTSIEEADAFLRGLMAGGGGVPRRVAETPLEKAQDLMYDAWGAPGSRERVRLARRALEVSPDCADAYVLLAEETARSAKEAVDLYAQGVAAGERALGKEAFEEYAERFWGVTETRPYMRARLGLAYALSEMDKRPEAIEHAWDLLRLNPGDNQGVRYLLLPWLLEAGDDAAVKRLLDLYRDEASATWMYGSALHAYRTEGDSKRARKLLAEAREVNPYVPAYLLGRKRLPRRLPETLGFGDESEAIHCAIGQVEAWQRTTGALPWLEEHSHG